MFVCLSRRFFVLDGEDVDFGDCCHTVRGFFAPGNGMNDVSSSWIMEGLL
jgi:hypothetical protein